jgi:Histidine kinase-like ATPase domain
VTPWQAAGRLLALSAPGGQRGAFSWRRAGGDPRVEITDEFFHAALARPGAGRAARHGLASVLAGWGVTGESAETAGLLVTELATNAEKFSRGGMTMTIWRLPGLLVIEVSDESRRRPVLRDARRGAESGRGLRIVDGLSQEWGYYRPRPGWKTVYCVLEIPAPEAGDEREGRQE